MADYMIRYKGVDRAGVAHTGAAEVADLGAWTEDLYRRGYRWLSAWVGANEANPVAEILPHPDTGNRIWWAEA